MDNRYFVGAARRNPYRQVRQAFDFNLIRNGMADADAEIYAIDNYVSRRYA